MQIKLDHFSIIMPAFNAAATIEQSILSIISQDYPAWTLYIIDDASADNTSEIVEKYASNDKRIIYKRFLVNGGVAAARNWGISSSDGEYIAFLDSDDLWLPHKLAVQRAYLHNGYDVVCSDYYYFSRNVSNITGKTAKKEFFNYSDMLGGNNIGNLTGVYNRIRLGSVAQISIGHEDYVMWLDLMSRTSKGYCVKQPLACYRIQDKSLSHNKFKAASWQWYIYRRVLNMPFILSLYYFLCYAKNAFVQIAYSSTKSKLGSLLDAVRS